jgi:SAM-dependent methyltransferase
MPRIVVAADAGRKVAVAARSRDRKMRSLMAVEHENEPSYLEPYARAVKRHGAEFRALLWASRRTQTLRFQALVHLQDPTGLTVLDIGCGRADLLDFFIERDITPRRYIGIEGVRELADAAQKKQLPNARTICADFIRSPDRMRVGADVIFCSGALNTVDDEAFYLTLRHAFDAAEKALVFNFLSSSLLAGTNYLRWRELRDVMKFARTICNRVEKHDGYIEGDCSIAMRKDLVE